MNSELDRLGPHVCGVSDAAGMISREANGAKVNVRAGGADVIYHMCRRVEWEAAVQQGSYVGSSQDTADGFIHFSTAEQLPESARRHRMGQPGLVLLAVDPQMLGAGLRWEPSRHGALFPHLYGTLPVSAVRSVCDLPLDDQGVPLLPALN